MSKHDQLSPAQNEATALYMQSPAWQQASAEFDAGAKKVEASRKRRTYTIEASKCLGVGALVLSIVVASRMLNHTETANQPISTEDVAANCVPVSGRTHMIDLKKSTLPLHPSDIDIAHALAAFVPGAEACDGNGLGANKYLSFIALLKLDQAQESDANLSLPPLTTILAEQTGGDALFTIPNAIDTSLSR